MPVKICKTEGCLEKHYAKGLCSKHYTMQRIYNRTHCIRYKHGHAVHGHVSREYQSYANMLSRCYNEKDLDYKNYGGRGISVCPEWRRSFLAYYEDMGSCPKGLTLDRRNNNGNYNPDNCRWASRAEQARNRRSCRLNIIAVRVIRWLLKNTDISQRRIADEYGVSTATISHIYLNKTWKEAE